MRIHRFTVPVNCYISDECAVTDKVQDSRKLYDDCGMLILPESYTDDGAPTRLVIICHGAGGTVSTDDSQIERQELTRYLVANGYAVMDVNGLPDKYAAERDIDIRNNIGSPIAVRSYVKAYHYCMDHFNLKPDVFVHGASMGGISSTNLVLSGMIPVIAHSAYCPVLDTYNQIYLHPWCDGLPKFALGKIYGLDVGDDGEYVYDESKVIGYNPAKNKKAETYPVPVKFWQCADDPVVSYEVTRKFIDTARANGCVAHLRTFPYGEHEPQLVGDPLENPSGIDVLDGLKIAVRPAVEETFIWIENFN